MNDLISVIIPIYNGEKYVKQALDSVINQTYNNLEIIIINDGSTDNSLNIIKDYQSKDKRIVIIDKQNNGVSSARNDGIKKSSGKYIMFLDSDDYLDNDYIFNMYNCLIKNNSDVCMSGIRQFNENKTIRFKKYLNEDKKLYFNDILLDIINTNEFNTIFKYIIDSDIIKKNNILFDTTLKYAEDLKFAYTVLKNSKSIYHYNICGYNYRINPSSVTNNLNIDKLLKWYYDDVKVLNYIKENENNVDDIINNRIFTKVNYNLYIMCEVKSVKYKEFKKIALDLLSDINNVDIKKINYLNKLNTIRIKLLYKRHLKSFYLISRITRLIKKGRNLK